MWFTSFTTVLGHLYHHVSLSLLASIQRALVYAPSKTTCSLTSRPQVGRNREATVPIFFTTHLLCAEPGARCEFPERSQCQPPLPPYSMYHPLQLKPGEVSLLWSCWHAQTHTNRWKKKHVIPALGTASDSLLLITKADSAAFKLRGGVLHKMDRQLKSVPTVRVRRNLFYSFI